jgi:nicotinamidase/pyrazinamidase
MKKKALIIVDCQYDFLKGGSLEIEGSEQIIPHINNIIDKFDLVIFTKDWHPKDSNYKNIKEHCLENTRGADISDELDISKIKGEFYIFKKGLEKKYHGDSIFYKTDLDEFLDEKRIDDVYICGINHYMTVINSAVDAKFTRFNPIVILDCVRGDDDNQKEMMEMLREEEIETKEYWQVPLI